jgi:MerR family copper efflux transcriptional regulator
MSELRTGELAKQAGVNVESLRFYEREGLLPEPPRRPSGYRRYPTDAVARVRFIKRAQELGFSLAEIRELLVIGTDPDGMCGEVKERVDGRIASVQQKIADLQRIETALRALADRCPESASSDQCPILQSLELKPLDSGKGQHHES